MTFCTQVDRQSFFASSLLFFLVITSGVDRPQKSLRADDEISKPPFASWGEESLTLIRERFWLPEKKLYSEFGLLPDGRSWQGSHPSFMWGVGVQLSALNAAASVAPEQYLSQAEDYADAINVYWLKSDGLEGYDVQPGPKDSDRYYDDNAWLVLALIELYEISKEQRHLEKAIATFRFVMSGADEKLGGGLYWREKELTSKNTCTNAPAIVSALRLYQVTGEMSYFDTARVLYEWTCEHLQDKDGLFWDSIQLDGRVDRRKFSYNTALMIRANALLHEVTGEERYHVEARRIAAAAKDNWIADDGAVRDSGRFAHLLLESLLELTQQNTDEPSVDIQWTSVVKRSLIYLHREVRNQEGWYGHRWEEPQRRSRWRIALIDQASAARVYWLAAKHLVD